MFLAGRVTSVHKVLASAHKLASKGRDIFMTSWGGYVYPRASDMGKKIAQLLEKEANGANIRRAQTLA